MRILVLSLQLNNPFLEQVSLLAFLHHPYFSVFFIVRCILFICFNESVAPIVVAVAAAVVVAVIVAVIVVVVVIVVIAVAAVAALLVLVLPRYVDKNILGQSLVNR